MDCDEWIFGVVADRELSFAISRDVDFDSCTRVTNFIARNDIAVGASTKTRLHIGRQWPVTEM